ncbi:MAG: N-6 DNA methylase [Rhodospirillales bacterium]
MARKSVRAESRARYYIRSEADRRGWNTKHVVRGGDFLEENEIVAHFPDIGLGLNRPDFLLCVGGQPAIVVEAKNEADKIQVAIDEAITYADQINDKGNYEVKIILGAAGEEDKGFIVELRFLTATGWQPLSSNGFELTSIPTKREVELALAAGDATTSVTIPEAHEFIDAAIELSRILRTAKVEAPLRPKVIGAIVLAMYQGDIDTTADNALASINSLSDDAITEAGDISEDKKLKLIDALKLSGADFDRLGPWIARVVAILRKLNVRSVLHTDTDFLGMFYEAFLRYGYDNNALGIVFTPRHITRFCVDLVGTSSIDEVGDIACGTGGFLVSAFDKMLSAAQGPAVIAKVKASIFGFDTNPTVWALAMLNMFFRGDGKSNIELGSCFEDANKRKVDKLLTKGFLNPPFSQDEEPEKDFLDQAMETLKPEGVLTAVVYAGMFADEPHSEWRRQFLRRHSLVAMVSLPEDLFYPTAAPTTIIVARAHVPMQPDTPVLMGRVWNDGFEKLKNRRIERLGNQLPEIANCFENLTNKRPFASEIATQIVGADLYDGAEWSPQEWLPQPNVSAAEQTRLQEDVIRSIFQSIARYPTLADEALEKFTEPWVEKEELPLNREEEISFFFDVENGKSTGEKNYAEGNCPYVSSGDTSNSIIRPIAPIADELFPDGAITVTAFGNAAIQPWPFMGRGNGGSAVRVLIPKHNLSFKELVWFAAQINLQRWRFFYARMSIKSRITRLRIKSPPTRLPDGGDHIATRIKTFRDTLNEFSTV